MRLAASWNYAELQNLLSGQGSGERQFEIVKDKLQIEEQNQLLEIERLNKKINDNPLLGKLKRQYDKATTEKKVKVEKQLKDETQRSPKEINYIRKISELDKQKENKAKRNLFELKNLDRTEMDRRLVEDLDLSVRNFRGDAEISESSIIPEYYSLSQNYPNPFNPVTTISYEIPKEGFVKILIYDITGREIMELVNDFKQAGKYFVNLNGINLASGVYFYKLEAGDFVATKKMVLVK